MMFSQYLSTHSIFKRQAKALIRLRVRAGWSEPLLVAHTTKLISWLISFSHRDNDSDELNLIDNLLVKMNSNHDFRDNKLCTICSHEFWVFKRNVPLGRFF